MTIQGIIRPPPEIRTVADRTALFVSKNGRAFEQRILNSEKGKTPKFAFLHETSPFHAYYEDRIRFNEEEQAAAKEESEKTGGDTAEGDGEVEETKTTDETRENGDGGKEDEGDGTTTVDKETDSIETASKTDKKEKKMETIKILSQKQKASAVDPIARALLSQRSKIDSSSDENPLLPPPSLHFVTITPPALVTSAQIDIYKLVGQFAALNVISGDNTFLRDLTQREWNNPLFGFIQPRHPHFAYFTALVDCYGRILKETRGVDSYFDGLVMVEEEESRKQRCLELVAYRAEYDLEMKARKERSEEGGGNGNMGGAAYIDWHEFVVVETIDFPTDEIVAALEPPPLPSPTIDEKLENNQAEEDHENHDDDDDDEMEMDSDTDDDDDDKEEINIVPSYEPHVVPTQATLQDKSRTHVVDPITGKSIPIAHMSEHMRIQLLDPKWAAEKKRFMEKQKESNFVNSLDIAKNINTFVEKKKDGGEDLFGSLTEDELAKQQMDEKMRLQEANRIIREQQQVNIPIGPTTPQPRYVNMAQPIIHMPQPIIHMTQPLPNMPMPTLPLPNIPPPSEIHQPANKKQRVLPPPIATPPITTPAVTIPLITIIPTPETPTEQPPPPPPPKPPIQPLTSITLFVSIPNSTSVSTSNWNFCGQTIDLTFSPSDTVKTVKLQLQTQLNDMPLNKMQLKDSTQGMFLKDALMLEEFCMEENVCVDLVPKIRSRDIKKT